MRRRANAANAGDPSGLLEPDARKRARPVLRGPGRSNAPGLPGELVGEKANGGKEYQPQGSPTRVDVHDFPDPNMGKAVPYGIYDIGADEGWVSVGDDGDTAVFAAGAIARWWETMGKARYPDATTGGSNSYRTKLWKVELAKLAATTGLTITVCHYPPGTSKWNRIEHRMFSFITKNWRGRPLTSYRTVVELRRHDHRDRAADRRGVGPRRLPDRHQGHQSRTRRCAPRTPRMAWRMNYDILPHVRT